MPELQASKAATRPSREAYADLQLDRQLCLALQISDSQVTRIYRELLKPLGLTHPQYLILLVMWEHRRCTMGDLRRALAMDTGAITPLVKRMEADGLLARTRDSKDERRVWVDLTERGWALRDDVAHVRQEVGRRLPLSPDEISELRRVLQRLNARLLAAV
ncbi:MarR family winged helix-turn-helix transcriptional regulator [Phenylobacterium sp. J367]|uniref:MarR family winged helix-turn-helix transcriptional regulator n=1 Tax=Phenylobacterium sp. J367 TaxID=2898435 RepID=UPI0021515423|nr:MarR family transcriptional regulator [Phenylobacterium sp. J367]MCR5879033.1 MarR family transcriptional regulator [Phenylobacterium sp. J367]